MVFLELAKNLSAERQGKIKNFPKKTILLGFCFLFSFFVFNFAKATTLEFNIDSSYDYMGRSKVSAFLHQMGMNANFYVEESYYQNLNDENRKEFTQALKNLSDEFDSVIYPKLTQAYGQEWSPGIDKDKTITVLITRIKDEAGGYFNEGDEYYKAQVPTSNEREMVYLSASYIGSPLAKNFLAHEFVHLITFNQKNKIYGQKEEEWLNEGRAEAASTLLGYDQDWANSNLSKRVEAFLQKPKDSLTEWRDLPEDCGVLDMFFQYVLDHYGQKILNDSLHSEKTGISSLNYALTKNGYSDDFSQIFTNWSIAVLVNNCAIGQKYCYLNQNLKNIRIAPQIYYLPLGEESTLSVNDYAKNWSGNWLKFIGGSGTLKFEFIGDSTVKFRTPYLKQDSSGTYSVGFLDLNGSQRQTIYIPDFGRKYTSFIIIPSIQSKISGFSDAEPFYKFIWSASIINGSSGETANQELINKLQAQIEFLKNEIVKIQSQINAILGQGGTILCQAFTTDLYYGMQGSQVSCLQEFLKGQGSGIYPEGLITGNFSSKTEAAVIRFQEKYALEILTPLGLKAGTGFVGPSTRQKINSLLQK